MPEITPPKEPSREELLAELVRLRQKVKELQQKKEDLEVLLEVTSEHSDYISEELRQEKDDLEMVLEMTTEHSDTVSEELHSKALELEDRNQFIRETFGRYVSDEVVACLLDSPEGLNLGGEKRKVTILMSDLRGFTALAERLGPQEVVTFLNGYLDAMVSVILAYHGTILEILGDGLMVIFGAPLQRENDAERAVACAVAMQLAMSDINEPNRRSGLPEIEMGIGIHTGEVVVGNIGSPKRTKYGAVGSDVNLTGRIESYTTGGQILISSATQKEIANLLKITRQMTVEPKGVAEPIAIYEVSGIGGVHNLFLPEHQEVLSPLEVEIPVQYTVLEEKFAGRTVFWGRFVKLSTREAELHTETPVALLSDLRIQLMKNNGEVMEGDLFAKVLSNPTERSARFLVRFTSIPPEVKAFLQNLLGVAAREQKLLGLQT
jgi:adenylate cyclase